MKHLGPVLLLVLAASFLLAPVLVHAGLIFILGVAMIEIVFALSWNMLFSYVGLASFGQAMFFGVGAYFSAAALKYGWDLHFGLVLILAALLGGLAAFVVAVIVLRRTSGIQLAILTLALSQLVVLLISYSNYLGRDEGLSSLPRPVMDFLLFEVDMSKLLQGYYFIIAVGTLAIGLMWLLLKGHLGREMRAVRIDPERAAFLGIDIWRVRVRAFTLAGGFAALAGALLAPWGQIVTLDAANWLHSAQPMLATLLGGSQVFWGPVIGVLAMSAVNYYTRTFAGLSEILIGGALLVVILLAPRGILGSVQHMLHRHRRRGTTPPETKAEAL